MWLYFQISFFFPFAKKIILTKLLSQDQASLDMGTAHVELDVEVSGIEEAVDLCDEEKKIYCKFFMALLNISVYKVKKVFSFTIKYLYHLITAMDFF